MDHGHPRAAIGYLLFDRYLTADPESVSRDEPLTFIGGKGEVDNPGGGSKVVSESTRGMDRRTWIKVS